MQQAQERSRELEKEIERWQSKNIRYAVQDLLPKTTLVNGVTVLAVIFNEAGRKGLREAVEQILNKFENAVVCLAAVEDEQVGIMVGVSKSLVAKFPANALVQFVSEQVGGKGGGSILIWHKVVVNLPNNVENALNSVQDWVKGK